MALSFLMVFAATVILIRPETPVTKVQTGSVLQLRGWSVCVCLFCWAGCCLLTCELCFLCRPSVRTHLSVVVRNRK